MKLLFAISVMLLASVVESKLEECKRPPVWKIGEIGEKNPLAEAQKDGKLVLVALLKASWPYCQSQAVKLTAIAKQLRLR